MAKQRNLFREFVEDTESSHVLDFITGKKLPNTPEEGVRQKVEHFLVEEKGYLGQDVLVGKSIPIVVGRKRLTPESDLVLAPERTYFMVIECKAPAEPLRPYKGQAVSYARLLEPPARYIVLTNWDTTEIYDAFSPDKLIGNSLSDIASRTEALNKLGIEFPRLSEKVIEDAKKILLTFHDPKEIANIFDKCHNAIRTQAGLDARARLYEMCKILISKLEDEATGRNRFSTRSLAEGDRVLGLDATQFLNMLFRDAKSNLADLFEPDEGITLNPQPVKEIVRMLEDYSLSETGEDILGLAFEVFLRKTMTGRELGEFFTPREIVDFMVGLIEPKIGESILDPACGSGGFLIKSFQYVLEKIRHSIKEEEQAERVRKLIFEDLWGLDIDAYLVKICKINLKIHGDGYEHIFRSDGLDMTDEPRTENARVSKHIKRTMDEDRGFDIILTNPPFGSGPNKDITDVHILSKYELGRDGGVVKNRQVPQILFLELCLRLLKPGGRLAIVLPDGILSNPKDKNYVAVRNLLRERSEIKAIIGIPQGAFNPYGSGVKPTVLLAEKK